MGNREGDVRIYIVVGLFLVCIVAGGVFLCAYMFLPDNGSNSWIYLTGIGLEAVPWIFWLLTYVYSCLKPRPAGPPKGSRALNTPLSGRSNSSVVTATAVNNNPASPMKNSSRRMGGGEKDEEDQRRVHFGAVVVFGNDESEALNGHRLSVEGNNGNKSLGMGELEGDHCHSNSGSNSSMSNDQDLSTCSRESEMPLNFGVSSCK